MPQGPVIKRPTNASSTTGIWRILGTGNNQELRFNSPLNNYEGASYTHPQFVILHFEVLGASKLATGQQVTVHLNNGQDDIFDENDKGEFWTRPAAAINNNPELAVTVDIGAGTPTIRLVEYGYGVLDIFMLNGDPSPGITEVEDLGIFTTTPLWEPITNLPASDSRRQNAEGVGLMVYVRADDPANPNGDREIGVCTASVIKDNWIMTCAHCTDSLTSTYVNYPANQEDYRFLEITSGSFTLTYNPLGAGVTTENNIQLRPKFYKLREPERTGFRFTEPAVVDPAFKETIGTDYIVIQVNEKHLPGGKFPKVLINPQDIQAGAPPGTFINLPADDEQLYIIHHPRGRTKRISRAKTNNPCVQARPSQYSQPAPNFHERNVITICDVDAGSSGSPIFDSHHKVVGIARDVSINGNLSNSYSHNWGPRIQTIINDLVNEDLDQYMRAAIAVDSSGSMGLTDVGSGHTKMYDANQAIEKFLNLLRYTNTAQSQQHRITVYQYDHQIDIIKPMNLFAFGNAGQRDNYVCDVTGCGIFANSAFVVGGSTSIGGALVHGAAQVHPSLAGGVLPAADSNKIRSILLLTDGLHNTGTSIAASRTQLNQIPNFRLHTIGFGEGDALNSTELNILAETYNGDFLRDGDGLNIKKFYAIEYGQMLETGVGLDPPRIFPAGGEHVETIPFYVIDEDSLTVSIGWDRPDSALTVNLRTPKGDVLSANNANVQYESGDTWAFIRVALPIAGEKSGQWEALIQRETTDLVLRGHIAPVLEVDFSPDGLHLLSASADSDVRLWNVRYGRCVRQFFRYLGSDEDDYPVALEFSKDNTFGMMATRKGNIYLLNLDRGRAFLKIELPNSGQMIDAVLTANGKWVVGAVAGEGIVIWSIADFITQLNDYAEIREPTYVMGLEDIRDIAAHPTESLIAVISPSSSTGLFLVEIDGDQYPINEVENDQLVQYFDRMVVVEFSPDGQYLFIGLDDGLILRVHSQEEDNLRLAGDNMGQSVRELAPLPSNLQVLTCLSGDETGYLMQIDGGVAQIYKGHKGPVNGVTVNPNGDVSVTASDDHTLRVWSTHGGNALYETTLFNERYYIVNLIDAGVYMRVEPSITHYTGDTLYPQVALRYKTGARVAEAKVTLEITRPLESIGAKLQEYSSQIDPAESVGFKGDTIGGRQAMLVEAQGTESYNRQKAIEDSFVGENEYNYDPVIDAMYNTRRSFVRTETQRFELFDDGEHFDGAMEADGIYSNEITDFTQYEGEYQFRAIAHFGDEEQYTREIFWTMSILPGIDRESSDVNIDTIDTNENGRIVIIRFFPRDKYGNPHGPGLTKRYRIEAAPSNTVRGELTEPSPGLYQATVVWSGAEGTHPGILIRQPYEASVRLPPFDDTPDNGNGDDDNNTGGNNNGRTIWDILGSVFKQITTIFNIIIDFIRKLFRGQ